MTKQGRRRGWDGDAAGTVAGRAELSGVAQTGLKWVWLVLAVNSAQCVCFATALAFWFS